MRLLHDQLQLAATDLGAHLACRHLTTLEVERVCGERQAPPPRPDPQLLALRERGAEHERSYLNHLQATAGISIEVIAAQPSLEAAAVQTFEAMRRGVDGIAQGVLLHGAWSGRPDVLRRVDQPSELLGGWSYEPHDCKLAHETRAETVLQLCLYCELLAQLQGSWPEYLTVVTPAGGIVAPERYRVAEYRAYCQRVRDSLLAAVGRRSTYPLPCEHCEVCRWAAVCDAKWRADDHPCLVAGMRRSAERELADLQVLTLGALATWEPDPGWRPRHGAAASYRSLSEQAQLQRDSRGLPMPLYQLLPVVEGEQTRGLARLPPPSPGDVFLDLEGDPFYDDRGSLEYLFGSLDEDGYTGWWALDRAAERAAFIALVDHLVARSRAAPEMHVYHYAAYEATAFQRLGKRHGVQVLKQLASRYGVGEEEVDELLRGERFVDLYPITRQALRAGVESYSIKRLEPLYDFQREVRLHEAGRARAELEADLELGRATAIPAATRALVEAYNRDDCRSARALRDWLEARRAQLEADGIAVPRPGSAPDPQPNANVQARIDRIRAVAEPMLAGLPGDAVERTPDQQRRWMLAQFLDYNRREDRVSYWEKFRLDGLDDADRREEPYAIAGLVFQEELPRRGREKTPVHRYRFPPQDVDERTRDAWVDKSLNLGEIDALDAVAGVVDVKKKGKTAGIHPSSVFLWRHVGSEAKEESLLRLGAWVLAHGVGASADEHRVARDLLLGITGRGCARDEEGRLVRRGEETAAAATRLVLQLDRGVLPLQGPPGAGKTYTGARIILELVRLGRRVGVTALSYKVIRNLLDEVVEAATKASVPMRCMLRVSDGPQPRVDGAAVIETTDYDEVREGLADGAVQVAAGTPWLWSRADFAESVHTLFVDEAGQMALADALAVATGGRNLVLIGDPQQLEQPVQAAHPEGCDVAALAHLLEGSATMPPERGVFLDHTWRLHPALCAFTSEQFYDGRLRSRTGLEARRFHGPPPFDRSGLYFLPVEHDGCTSSSVEEAGAVAALVESWLEMGATWSDIEGPLQTLRLDQILVVTPYNAQVALLRRALPTDARVGTVDKFQGQEAPVVIYSMATSGPEEAPRGMEFLYSLNRLNVATSRAQCACVVVASPRLLEPECKSPRQMRLANALCRYVEMATPVVQGCASSSSTSNSSVAPGGMTPPAPWAP